MHTFRRSVYFSLLLIIISTVGKSQAPRIVVNPLGHSAKIHNLLFTPDGHQIISVSEDKTIRIWNAETGEMMKKFESQIGEGPEGMFYTSRFLQMAGY